MSTVHAPRSEEIAALSDSDAQRLLWKETLGQTPAVAVAAQPQYIITPQGVVVYSPQPPPTLQPDAFDVEVVSHEAAAVAPLKDNVYEALHLLTADSEEEHPRLVSEPHHRAVVHELASAAQAPEAESLASFMAEKMVAKVATVPVQMKCLEMVETLHEVGSVQMQQAVRETCRSAVMAAAASECDPKITPQMVRERALRCSQIWEPEAQARKLAAEPEPEAEPEIEARPGSKSEAAKAMTSAEMMRELQTNMNMAKTLMRASLGSAQRPPTQEPSAFVGSSQNESRRSQLIRLEQRLEFERKRRPGSTAERSKKTGACPFAVRLAGCVPLIRF
eukprot:SAG11_NODE_180_length_13278_cov_9.158434_15_plen_334_part_00